MSNPDDPHGEGQQDRVADDGPDDDGDVGSVSPRDEVSTPGSEPESDDEAKTARAAVVISKRLVLVNSASFLLTFAVKVSVLVWLQQFLLRRIPAAEYALYPVLLGVMVYFPLLTSIFSSGVARYITAAYARNNRAEVTRIISSIVPALSATTAVVAVCGSLLVWQADWVFAFEQEYLSDARIMLGLMVFSFCCEVVLVPFSVGLYVRQQFVLLNALKLGKEFLRLGLLLGLLYHSVQVLWVAVAATVAALVELTVRTVISQRLMPSLRYRPGKGDWAMLKELTSFGSWSFLSQVARALRAGAIPIVLQRLATPVDVSCYHLGVLVMDQMRNLARLALSPLGPVLTAMHATGDDKRVASTYLRGGRYGLWYACALSVPGILYREELVELYVGNRFSDTATVLLLVLAPNLLNYGQMLLSEVAKARAKVKGLAIVNSSSKAINVVLAIALVGAFELGAVGAALSLFIVRVFFEGGLLTWLGLKLSGVSLWRWLKETFWPGTMPAWVGLVVWEGMRRWLEPDSWILLFVCVVTGGICYLVVQFGFAMRPYERREVLGGIRRVLKRFR